MIQEKKLTSIRLNRDLYKALQKRAKEENRSVNNFIETTLFDVLYREPNAETMAAIEEAQEMMKNGTGKSYSNVDELLKDLMDE